MFLLLSLNFTLLRVASAPKHTINIVSILILFLLKISFPNLEIKIDIILYKNTIKTIFQNSRPSSKLSNPFFS